MPRVIQDQRSAQPDTAAFSNGFARVTAGEHRGKLVVPYTAPGLNPDGSPKTCVVRTRDADHQLITVPYKDLEPAVSEGVGAR